MELGVTKGGQWVLDAEAMRAIITGKMQWKRCFNCQEGKVWCDGHEGVECSPKFVEDTNDEDRFYQDVCNDCDGVGFTLVSMD